MCRTCGGALTQIDSYSWKCPYCKNTYTDEKVRQDTESIQKLLKEHDIKTVSNLRHTLYNQVTAENPSKKEIVRTCTSILALMPDDVGANFFYTVETGTKKDISAAMREFDVEKNAEYVELVIRFCIKNVTRGTNLALSNLIERAYRDTDLTKLEKYKTEQSREMDKVDKGIYSTTIPRDAFIAYSSKDMKRVEELVEVLEDNNITCFVSARNLRHGANAVENYQHALEEAMDNCKIFVFVSSLNSRNVDCDALIYEIPHIKKKDIENTPFELRQQDYTKIPSIYKKPRIEYRIENSKFKNAADATSDEFFKGYQYKLSPQEVAKQIIKIKSDVVVTTPPSNEETIAVKKSEIVLDTKNAPSAEDVLLNKAMLYLSDGQWDMAEKYCYKILDNDPNNANAYFIKLLVSLRLTNENELLNYNECIDFEPDYMKALSCATGAFKEKLKNYSKAINKRVGKDTFHRQELVSLKYKLEEEIRKATEEKSRMDRDVATIERELNNIKDIPTKILADIEEKKKKRAEYPVYGFNIMTTLIIIAVLTFLFVISLFNRSSFMGYYTFDPSEQVSVLFLILITLFIIVFACTVSIASFLYNVQKYSSSMAINKITFMDFVEGVKDNFSHYGAGNVVAAIVLLIFYFLSGVFTGILYALGIEIEIPMVFGLTLPSALSALILIDALVCVVLYLRTLIKYKRFNGFANRYLRKSINQEVNKLKEEYNSHSKPNGKLDELKKKKEETDLANKETLSKLQKNVQALQDDYNKKARLYSLPEIYVIPSWLKQ